MWAPPIPESYRPPCLCWIWLLPKHAQWAKNGGKWAINNVFSYQRECLFIITDYTVQIHKVTSTEFGQFSQDIPYRDTGIKEDKDVDVDHISAGSNDNDRQQSSSHIYDAIDNMTTELENLAYCLTF